MLHPGPCSPFLLQRRSYTLSSRTTRGRNSSRRGCTPFHPKDYARAEQFLISALHEKPSASAPTICASAPRNIPSDWSMSPRANSKRRRPRTTRRSLIFEKEYGEDSLDVAHVNFNIATVMFDEEHQAEALHTQRRRSRYTKGSWAAAAWRVPRPCFAWKATLIAP